MSRRLLLLRRWLECSPGPERRDLVARGGFAQHEEHSGALLLQRIVGRAVQHERAKHLDRRARRRAVAGAQWHDVISDERSLFELPMTRTRGAHPFTRRDSRRVVRRFSRPFFTGASFTLLFTLPFTSSLVPTAAAQGQDAPRLARALERADRFDAALGPQPQPTAQWLGGDRLAYSPTGAAPWSVLDAATGRVLESEANSVPTAGQGPPGHLLGPYPNPGRWTAQVSGGELVVSDNAGNTRLKLQGAQNYGWGVAPLGWNRDGNLFVALRVDSAALDFSTENWPWQVTPLPDDSGFLWMSERDGWRHVYHYGYDGALKKKVTAGAFPVHRVVRVDSARRQIYVLASADSSRPYDRHVYRVALGDTGFTALTSAPGQHAPVFSPSGNFFIDSYSSLTQPHTVELRRTDGTLIKRLGQAPLAKLAEAGYTPPMPFRVKAADGTTDVYGVLYRPVDFDSTKRYPIVDYIYAGPFLAVHQMTYVPSGGAGAMHRISASLAQMGFVVAMLDARGTPGRGKAFQDANYGRIGQIEISDHVAALRALARSRPYIDTTRAGIVGHSWGGYFALRGMLTAPDFFKVGYAGAPGDLTEAASINEPNMGLSASNQTGYDAGSNVRLASALRGKLKIMHGTSDVMAPLSTTMRMVQALIQANKTVDLLIMPGQPHGPQGPAGRYYREDVRRFLTIHLLGADAPTGRQVPN